MVGMTQPMIGGRPQAPAPGATVPELRIARFRGQARRLFWSALILIATCGALGYFTGNLVAPFANWMLYAAAAVVVFLFVLLPFLAWWSRVYTITNRRVIERTGVFTTRRRELSHVRGYTIQVRRGPLQRLWGAGTITLWNGVDAPMRLVNVPSVTLVHETLVDQVEIGQILAHRDAQTLPAPPPIPPPPPLPSGR